MPKNEQPPPEPVTYTPITVYTPELLALNVNEQGSNGSMRWNPAYVDYWLAAKNGQPVPEPGGLQVDDPNCCRGGHPGPQPAEPVMRGRWHPSSRP